MKNIEKRCDDMTSVNTVKHDNKLTSARYLLSLGEQRLVLLAMTKIKVEQPANEDLEDVIEVTGKDYADLFNSELQTAYQVLQEASKKLFNRHISYTDIDPRDGKKRDFRIRWVDKVGYKHTEGTVYLRFSRDVEPLLLSLENRYTIYELENLSQLKSIYAIRLYQLCMQWKSQNFTQTYKLEDFRGMMGVEAGKYEKMCDFKKYVLDFALNQINTLSDIEIYNPNTPEIDKKTGKFKKQLPYIQLTKGRTVTGFQFYFREKKLAIEGKCKDISHQRDPHVIEQTNKEQASEIKLLSQKQADFFASKLCNDSNFGGRYAQVGEDMQPFIYRISNELQRDMSKLALYMPYLLKAGFKKELENSIVNKIQNRTKGHPRS